MLIFQGGRGDSGKLTKTPKSVKTHIFGCFISTIERLGGGFNPFEKY